MELCGGYKHLSNLECVDESVLIVIDFAGWEGLGKYAVYSNRTI